MSRIHCLTADVMIQHAWQCGELKALPAYRGWCFRPVVLQGSASCRCVQASIRVHSMEGIQRNAPLGKGSQKRRC